jgi:hypothetical protein
MMEIKTVSPAVFASTNKDKSKVFAVSNIKSIDGVVVNVVNLYAAKQYGSDVIVQTTELQGVENSTMYDAKNIVQSDDDAIAMVLNAIV